ncbi:probable LRR receptor-like serine/threonine-protein kinase At3g47570 isoform X1 [Oryza glaberrima]|uniref:probable LRR receptor-like serine/threonine-protein kinase At3g47570 isoform X1 n=1 Tax=Oryza glaberrima TaxID=4538 RepID=UPI00023DFBA4|nr:probable LRR receptor-like serine/threonine-protein kinase At3g47570 isoform X1 [Oryza glaberrima]
MSHFATHEWPMLLLILVRLLIIFPALNSDTDRDALLCLKSQLSDPSGALASWRNDSSMFCDWHGVTCSRHNASQVISLDLESLNLTGQIFPCIAQLSFLSRIHMSDNQLNGHISPDIGLLTRLTYLNLSMNSLNGVIPHSISSCSRLEVISLQSNSLQGEIPQSLAQCSFLQKIVLSNNNLQGSIPSKFGLLANLSVILLSSNSLSGSIPELLGSSRSLTEVNLNNNSISGKIPPSIFNSTTLSYIDLSHNHLSGSIPPFSKSSMPLQLLSLAENNLTGEIPVSLGNISSLSFLLLSQNNLQGSIPGSLSKIVNLRVLNLKYNNLSGIVPPALFNISSLTDLILNNNQLVGTIPANLGSTLPNITELVIGGNQFEGQIPNSLANASNLQTLDIRSNLFSGHIPSLGLLSELKMLDLGTNMLQAGDWTFLSSLTNCPQLKSLSLDFNGFEGKIPISIGNLSKSLEELHLMANQLTGDIPSEIGKLTGLTVITLGMNGLTGHIPDTLQNLQNLSVLSLSKNKLSGEIPQSIGKLEQLTELHLRENELTGRIPTSLAGCKNLVQLNLSSNSFHGSIPQELFSISTLSISLDLSNNQLTGDIPMEIGKLINLNSLSISNNQLSGEIPSNLGNCLLLQSLHLEANFLNGHIPSSLINLRGIVEMDLSQNNLSGEIPEFFGSFSSLKILNLSFNNLIGPVPKGGVFDNSSAVCIQGNNKLCASSPMLQLPLCVESPSKRKKTPYIFAILVPVTTIVIITMACLITILLKKRYKARQPINQSLKQFKSFSYHDLFKATYGFSSSNIIGSGRFGLVYRGYIESDVSIVAIKVFRLDQFGAPNNFIAECEAFRNIRHRNLIRVISLCSTFDPAGNEFKALILEHMANGNLESWLHPKRNKQIPKEPLSLASRLSIAMDIAVALDYLHNQCSPPLVHCDLKPSNVLLDDEMVAHVSDFGLAKFLYNDSSMASSTSYSMAGPRGSIGYIAPEYAMGCKISFEGDIYSYGIILLEMITGMYPTDEMFTDGMNLHKMVLSAIPHKITEILEPSLTKDYLGEDRDHELVELTMCTVMQLAELGLRCTVTLPKDRPKIKDVYTEIISIQSMFSALNN